ncbi:MAG TPA: alanine racemase [Rhodothermales bacterium]|nr:alanine racemase [Rhodothermales bacterium]
MLLDDLPTPAVLIERSRLEANIQAMQALAAAQGVALRPHVKTHKSVEIARMQRDAGARCLTAAKPAEAEVFAEAGFQDLGLAYPTVGEERLRHVRRLAERTRLWVGADTAEGVRALSAAFADAPAPLDVRLEVDTGYGRSGVRSVEEAVALGRLVAELPGLHLAGIFTHEGHAYAGPANGESLDDARRRVMVQARDGLLAVAEALGVAGLADPAHFAVSMGSTPTAHVFENASRGPWRITELRPGNYVFHDAQQVALGSVRIERCALTVLATVVSRHERTLGQERFFLDAGKKVFTTDLGYARRDFAIPLYNARTMRPHPHLSLDALSEEHGWVRVRGHATLEVGDRLRLVPNHACVCVHTQSRLYLVDGETVLEELPVDARDGSR